MNRKHIASGMVIVCTAWTLAACSNQAESQDVTWKIESNLQQIVNGPEMTLTSSNPGDYIVANTAAYVQILDTGEEGLNVLIQQLESSSNDGLKEWVMAQASVELLGAHNPVENWQSGKDWLREYKMKVE
ncbi:hypothetical protein JNUCC31_23905 [Paenibacillus sp. JNUCC31]|uniref:hypothetical protein n=1 Tax=Paenibacillus sp. JNUCC-31 TaxID=2777983 RepID=UPI001785A1F8|nr:hypothetical protein [Paenibacillus sp. JNUCC-31]QOS77769.1 hypothetical protein JNUCC31_23905 [Paenibacillus sp. JNUCC-31]